MAYKVLYRIYRPDSFKEMAGQTHIVKTLNNVVHQDKIAHAYLFCGPRGTGKTSAAKIFAKAVNCTASEKPCGHCENCLSTKENNHPDIIEIDAASNNGVDEVRNLIDKVKYAPLLGKYKIYIIDEVHMMSQGAYNALLKTIEEPPAHVIFIFATTEPHKVLPTIISRCQRFDFSKISNKDIIDRLALIVEKEHIQVAEDVLHQISILADGGMRDALSILDQCYAYAPDKIETKHVFEIYGIITVEEKMKLIAYIAKQDVKSVIACIEKFNQRGIDIKRLTSDAIELLKEKVIYDYTKDPQLLSVLTYINIEELQQLVDTKTSLKWIDILMENYENYKFASNPVSYLEIAVLKMMEFVSRETIEKKVVKEVKADVVLDEVVQEPSPNKEQDLQKVQLQVEEVSHSIQNIEDVEEESIPHKSFKEVENVSQTTETKSKILDDEFVLRLLVGASKDEKNEDKSQIKGIHAYKLEEETARYANLLAPTEIVASSKTYFIVTSNTQAIANEINDLDEQGKFQGFIHLLFKKPKRVFAINDVQYKRVVDEFRNRYSTQNLPESVEIKLHIQEEKKEEDETMTGLQELFGSNIEIKE
ncbi:MAG: DNA polymerase III subunit gamma/tau [Breznakia sp.]